MGYNSDEEESPAVSLDYVTMVGNSFVFEWKVFNFVWLYSTYKYLSNLLIVYSSKVED